MSSATGGRVATVMGEREAYVVDHHRAERTVNPELALEERAPRSSWIDAQNDHTESERQVLLHPHTGRGG
ncbi:MAG TPA: hypothetical protein VFP84_30935 [Kofleriaceae bacterium]|nr:hypothetical protein [Kofleriaceae bacterium]